MIIINYWGVFENYFHTKENLKPYNSMQTNDYYY